MTSTAEETAKPRNEKQNRVYMISSQSKYHHNHACPTADVPHYTGICIASHLNCSNRASSPFSAGFVTPMNGLSLASHNVPSGGSLPVWIYARTCRAMHRLGELIMQWPSESDAKTTEPGQRVAMVWALYIMFSIRWCGDRCWGWREAYFRSGVTGSRWLPRMSIGSNVCPLNGPGTRHFGLML